MIDKALVLITDKCDIYKERVDLLTPEEFTNIRRNTIGASDSSVILGLQSQWKTTEDLITEKLRTSVTPDEIEIGHKATVRMGRDLEPFILHKAEEVLAVQIIKPPHMYTLKEYPYLSINFDGVAVINDILIPIEAKTVSQYGDKYYNKEQCAYEYMFGETVVHKSVIPDTLPYENLDIPEKAKVCGIPPYYYAQVQQQLMATEAPFAYLAALHVKDWTLRIYQVPNDTRVQEQIALKGYEVYQRIKKLRG
jgi:hypothetical protein